MKRYKWTKCPDVNQRMGFLGFEQKRWRNKRQINWTREVSTFQTILFVVPLFAQLRVCCWHTFLATPGLPPICVIHFHLSTFTLVNNCRSSCFYEKSDSSPVRFLIKNRMSDMTHCSRHTRSTSNMCNPLIPLRILNEIRFLNKKTIFYFYCLLVWRRYWDASASKNMKTGTVDHTLQYV